MDDVLRTVLNMVYHAAVISGLAYGYTMLFESLLDWQPATMGSLGDIIKVVFVLTISISTKDFLVEKRIIPRNIN